MKALIISVGTGTSRKPEAVESLAKAIAFSLENHNPDTAFFVVSEESRKTTLPLILQKTELSKYETITVQNPDDIQQIFETLREKFKEIKNSYTKIAVDYTSGTKAMTSALTILGTIYEADTLSYITGKRVGGIVQHGTEKINTVRPHFATAEEKIKIATRLFNQNQFQAAATIIDQMLKETSDPQLVDRVKPLKNLAEAYDKWERFRHKEAFEIIKTIEKPELNRNKRFLGMLTRHLEKKEPPQTNLEPFYIADLINNAKRRGTKEGRYDDALARLYRTIELIAQYKLRKKYGILTSQAKPNQIPKRLLHEWNIPPKTENIRLPLARSYQILEEKDDELGKKYREDKKLKDLLSKRNQSILAHGTTPIDQKTYQELYKKTIKYASTIIKNLNKLLKDSTFITFPQPIPT